MQARRSANDTSGGRLVEVAAPAEKPARHQRARPGRLVAKPSQAAGYSSGGCRDKRNTIGMGAGDDAVYKPSEIIGRLLYCFVNPPLMLISLSMTGVAVSNQTLRQVEVVLMVVGLGIFHRLNQPAEKSRTFG